MNRLTTLDINKLTPYAVGFDRVFDDMFKYIEHNTSSTGYPPYNIIRDGEKFQIELALSCSIFFTKVLEVINRNFFIIIFIPKSI